MVPNGIFNKNQPGLRKHGAANKRNSRACAELENLGRN